MKCLIGRRWARLGRGGRACICILARGGWEKGEKGEQDGGDGETKEKVVVSEETIATDKGDGDANIKSEHCAGYAEGIVQGTDDTQLPPTNESKATVPDVFTFRFKLNSELAGSPFDEVTSEASMRTLGRESKGDKDLAESTLEEVGATGEAGAEQVAGEKTAGGKEREDKSRAQIRSGARATLLLYSWLCTLQTYSTPGLLWMAQTYSTPGLDWMAQTYSTPGLDCTVQTYSTPGLEASGRLAVKAVGAIVDGGIG
ncbi:hypothetical protein B0A55_13005 [Friedmanniomyces simplex]|uniref:Uncharacterized protein n=1 Tax=Friedmanniomyces simplex TaxID=329884 RepID=A0A4U0VNG4_9PEZI|nr:hypothetical protein B0A55_13005 [Friedmanniomyces simplex]